MRGGQGWGHFIYKEQVKGQVCRPQDHAGKELLWGFLVGWLQRLVGWPLGRKCSGMEATLPLTEHGAVTLEPRSARLGVTEQRVWPSAVVL